MKLGLVKLKLVKGHGRVELPIREARRGETGIGLELATSMERMVSTVGIVVITDAFKDDVSHPSWWSLGF
jgi:hypothetical protein